MRRNLKCNNTSRESGVTTAGQKSMPPKATVMLGKFSASVTINSEPFAVWIALTDPELKVKWIGDPELEIEVLTNWE